MAPKPGNFAILEGIRGEMLNDPHITMLYEYQRPTAVSASGQVIDLYKEFGPVRIPDWGPIDEEWFVGAAQGLAMAGVRSIAHVPSMCTVRCFDLVFNQMGKLRHMTGGQVNMPMVLWQDAAGRNAGMAGQHADAGQEALYAAIPGVKVVVPSNPYDAKGLMISALRDADPVVFFHYAGINNVQIDVPDDQYTVAIGEANVLQEGTDLTIVGVGPAVIEMNKAVDGLKEAGISAELIDLRTIKPLPIDTIIASVRKTGKLLAVDHGHETLGTPAEIIARVAMAVPGTKLARITFPDAPPPGSREIISWMTPDAPKIVEAARKVVA